MRAARRPSSWFALELTHKMKRTYAGIAGEEPIVSEFDGILGRRTRIVEHLARFHDRVVPVGVVIGTVRTHVRATAEYSADNGAQVRPQSSLHTARYDLLRCNH